MNDSEFDTVSAREPPDYRVGNVLLHLSQWCDFGRLIGIDSATCAAVSELAHESYRAISIRGARVGALVSAVSGLRARSTAPEEVPLVDAKVASLAERVCKQSDAMHRLGVSYETFERIRLLADAVQAAILERGASARDIVTALRGLQPDGSILMDLPSAEDLPTLRPRPRSKK